MSVHVTTASTDIVQQPKRDSVPPIPDTGDERVARVKKQLELMIVSHQSWLQIADKLNLENIPELRVGSTLQFDNSFLPILPSEDDFASNIGRFAPEHYRFPSPFEIFPVLWPESFPEEGNTSYISQKISQQSKNSIRINPDVILLLYGDLCTTDDDLNVLAEVFQYFTMTYYNSYSANSGDLQKAQQFAKHGLAMQSALLNFSSHFELNSKQRKLAEMIVQRYVNYMMQSEHYSDEFKKSVFTALRQADLTWEAVLIPAQYELNAQEILSKEEVPEPIKVAPALNAPAPTQEQPRSFRIRLLQPPPPSEPTLNRTARTSPLKEQSLILKPPANNISKDGRRWIDAHFNECLSLFKMVQQYGLAFQKTKTSLEATWAVEQLAQNMLSIFTSIAKIEGLKTRDSIFETIMRSLEEELNKSEKHKSTMFDFSSISTIRVTRQDNVSYKNLQIKRTQIEEAPRDNGVIITVSWGSPA